MLSLFRFLAHRPEVLAAELAECTVLPGVGYSALLLGLLPGGSCGLWMLCLLQHIFVSLVVIFILSAKAL